MHHHPHLEWQLVGHLLEDTRNQMRITFLWLEKINYFLIYWGCMCIAVLTTGWPLLTDIPSWSIMLREMVIEGRSRLWGGNWGIKGPLCGTGGSGIAGKGESTSVRPRPDSISGGGVMGGISNSSSPKLGVWKVCKGGGGKKKVTKSSKTKQSANIRWGGPYLTCRKETFRD